MCIILRIIHTATNFGLGFGGTGGGFCLDEGRRDLGELVALAGRATEWALDCITLTIDT